MNATEEKAKRIKGVGQPASPVWDSLGVIGPRTDSKSDTYLTQPCSSPVHGATMVNDCPHSRIEFCPLYVAAHEGGGLGCDDGRLGEHEVCAVHRKLDYGRALAKLSLANRELVQECAERESHFMKVEQRQRNMKNLGLH